MFFLAILVAMGAESFAQSDDAISCAISDAERERILQLPVDQFDQTENEGWRIFYGAKCYEIASQLLVDYTNEHPDRAAEHYMLPFHTGQLLAMAGQLESSIGFLKRGYTDTPSTFVDWNAFVDAHIAFIRRDREELLEMRARIDLQPTIEAGSGFPDWMVGKKLNRDVVDGFINCFDKPFAIAYDLGCRPD